MVLKKHILCLIFVIGLLSWVPILFITGRLAEKIRPPPLPGQDVPPIDDSVEARRSAFPSGTVISRDVSSQFCQQWTKSSAFNRTLQPFDIWHTHHPNWIVTYESENMFCVEPYCEEGSDSYPCSTNDRRSNLIKNFMIFYNNQFNSSCDKVHWRKMWSSGWSADFLNVQEGLIDATNNFHIPLVMGAPWHYAAVKKDLSHKTCKSADLTCYFLPYHSCGSLDDICGFTPNSAGDECNGTGVERIETEEMLDRVEIWFELGFHAYLFMTRKQLWLRRAIFDFKQEFHLKQKPESDCSVIHVRRGDIILHAQHARKYYPISDYLDLIPNEKKNDPNHTIFLLTDDANAIKEAHEFHPNLRWKYIDRPRHKGSSGGWENQTPSLNPALELIVLMATFELVQDCSSLVAGHSGLADYLWTHMAANAGNKSVKRYRVDDQKEVFNEDNLHSEERLAKMLNEKRVNEKSAISKTQAATSLPNDVVEDEDCVNQPHSYDGLIVVNMLGLLANDLFEAAFVKVLAAKLGCNWHVVYRSSWNTAFPTPQTDRCFPNALAKNNNRSGNKNELLSLIRRLTERNQTQDEVLRTFDALTFNELELETSNNTFSDQKEANVIKEEWIKSLGDRALKIDHEEYHNEREEVIEPKNVLSILNDAPQMRVLDLNAFFINYRWMEGRMDDISRWLDVDPSCCNTPPPGKDTIVIHIRDFLPDDEDKNKNLKVGVYRDIIDKYSQSKQPEIVVVCQPRSVESDLVQGLVKDLKAVVQTGSDGIDAFCILSNARFIIPTTSSSFSQLPALLAQQKYGDVQVHYPTHTLDRPGITLKVPSWKYHLTNTDNDGISEFDVAHERLNIFHA